MSVLVDSLYINDSGGLVLLKYLVAQMEERTHDVHYIFDERCAAEFAHIPEKRRTVMKASLALRRAFYAAHADEYDRILCFGNLPPAKRHKARTFTYFHNINLLAIPKALPLKTRLMSRAKRCYFRLKRNNTDLWLVQTDNTRHELVKHLGERPERVRVIPFFDVEGASPGSTDGRQGYIYVSNYTPGKNFEYLISAWTELARRGTYPELHLTLSAIPQRLKDMIDEAVNTHHARIINHGTLSKAAIMRLYPKMKATVYTAFNESFGLCLIEAMACGCDVIGPSLPYISAVCRPSATFALDAPATCADSVAAYEAGQCPHTTPTMTNEIKVLLDTILT